MSPSAKKSGRLWAEFGIFFGLGFGVMCAYWLLREPPAAGAQAQEVVELKRGAPILSAGLRPTAQTGAEIDSKTQAPLTAGESYSGKTEVAPAAPAVPAAHAPTATPKPAEDEEAYQNVSFKTLGGYYYEPPDPEGTPEIPGLPRPKNEIPESVKAYHGKKVFVQGYMVPVRIEKGAVKAFVLCQSVPQCCFGDSLRMNQWVIVKMAGDKSAQYVPDRPVDVWGKLEVGEQTSQGVVLSLYRLEAEQVSGPPEL